MPYQPPWAVADHIDWIITFFPCGLWKKTDLPQALMTTHLNPGRREPLADRRVPTMIKAE
jgi:hypothetical protein